MNINPFVYEFDHRSTKRMHNTNTTFIIKAEHWT